MKNDLFLQVFEAEVVKNGVLWVPEQSWKRPSGSLGVLGGHRACSASLWDDLGEGPGAKLGKSVVRYAPAKGPGNVPGGVPGASDEKPLVIKGFRGRSGQKRCTLARMQPPRGEGTTKGHVLQVLVFHWFLIGF